MKKTLTAVAVAGLIALTGCGTASNSTAPENGADSSEASANTYQELADRAANATVANQTRAADAADANSAANSAGAIENMQ